MLTTAVIAGDKLSFTHSSLANGDLVYITYKYLSPMMSNTTITFIDNKQVVLGTGHLVSQEVEQDAQMVMPSV